MPYLIICLAAFLASGLTLFSGFGLGTLLFPVMALFFPIDLAIALTAVVHALNNLFKFWLLGRHANRGVVVKFGIPAILSALAGGLVAPVAFGNPASAHLPGLGPGGAGHAGEAGGGNTHGGLRPGGNGSGRGAVFPASPVSSPGRNPQRLFRRSFGSPRGAAQPFSPQGGVDQRKLYRHRGGHLPHGGYSPDHHIWPQLTRIDLEGNHGPLTAAVLAAFSGAWLGNRLLKKVTLRMVQLLVAAMLLAIAGALGSGLI